MTRRGEEKEYPLLHLPPGPVRLDDETLAAVGHFEPLRFSAAQKAITWLQVNLDAGRLPLDTYLVFSEDNRELYGFFVLELVEICIASGDVPIIQVRKKLADPLAPQPALKLVWIARSESSPKGFGQELFDQALAFALEADACALLVEPYDEATAKRSGSSISSCALHARTRAIRESGSTYGTPCAAMTPPGPSPCGQRPPAAPVPAACGSRPSADGHRDPLRAAPAAARRTGPDLASTCLHEALSLALRPPQPLRALGPMPTRSVASLLDQTTQLPSDCGRVFDLTVLVPLRLGSLHKQFLAAAAWHRPQLGPPRRPLGPSSRRPHATAQASSAPTNGASVR